MFYDSIIKNNIKNTFVLYVLHERKAGKHNVLLEHSQQYVESIWDQSIDLNEIDLRLIWKI